MAKRKGIPWRREIARRIVEAVERALPIAQFDVEENLVFRHAVIEVDLPTQPPSVWPSPICDPVDPAECHMMRLGGVAIATNPFELFTDYGVRMKTRSPALQTFVIQLTGSGGYLPSERAVRGGGYSGVIQSSRVGPEGGQVLVDRTVESLQGLWKK